MRRWTALVSALMLCLLCACGQPIQPPEVSETPEPSATAVPVETFALGYDPTASLHPITSGSQVNLDLAGLVYEGLYELDRSFAAQPLLAQSSSVDESGLIWTITLRDGVLFSDGTELTAEHAAASLKKAKGSDRFGSRLSDVVSVQVKDNDVLITLSAPNSALPALLDIPVVLEQEDGIPLGTGPYRFLEGEQGLSLSVNGNHSEDGLPYQTILLREVPTADRRIAAFDSGEVSAVVTDTSSPYALGYSGNYEIWDFPTTNLLYVGFRTNAGFCANEVLRRACSMAFDRSSVVQSLLEGHGDPTSLPVHPGHREHSGEAAAELSYDIQRARELLAEEGYTLNEEDGLLYEKRTPVELTLVVNRDNLVKQEIAEYLAVGLSDLGITVKVERLGWDAYVKALERGTFDLYIGEVRLTGDFDLTELLTGELNYGNFSHEQLLPLLEQRQVQGDVGGLWDLLTQQVPLAPICFKRGSVLVRWNMATNLTPTQGNPFYGIRNWGVVNE